MEPGYPKFHTQPGKAATPASTSQQSPTRTRLAYLWPLRTVFMKPLVADLVIVVCLVPRNALYREENPYVRMIHSEIFGLMVKNV